MSGQMGGGSYEGMGGGEEERDPVPSVCPTGCSTGCLNTATGNTTKEAKIIQQTPCHGWPVCRDLYTGSW